RGAADQRPRLRARRRRFHQRRGVDQFGDGAGLLNEVHSVLSGSAAEPVGTLGGEGPSLRRPAVLTPLASARCARLAQLACATVSSATVPPRPIATSWCRCNSWPR